MSICGRSHCFCKLKKLAFLYFPDTFLSQTCIFHTDRSTILSQQSSSSGTASPLFLCWYFPAWLICSAGEREETGRDVSLSLLVSRFLRSYGFIFAVLCGWAGMSPGLTSPCAVSGGSSGRCAAGACPHPSPTQPHEAVAHINQGKPSALLTVGAGAWAHNDIRWMSHYRGAPTSAQCMFCVQQVCLPK